MELPDLGDHCSLGSCSRLDFLPVKCGGCRKLYCGEHYPSNSHNCPSPVNVDVRVPVCPLCDKPIPLRRKGDPPDLLVSAHIDTDCQSDPAKENRQKIFNNACSKRKCKKKELVRIQCNECKSNYCLQHRHPKDHDCQGSKAIQERAREAANSRLKNSNQSNKRAQIESDEAIAKALQASFQAESNNTNSRMSQEEMDRMMALSLAQENSGNNQSQRSRSNQSSSNNSCSMS